MRRASATLVLLACWPVPVVAQVAAPSLVEEDLPEEAAPVRTDEPPPPPARAFVPSPRAPLDTAPIRLARPIEPVRSRFEDVQRAWHDRRNALREGDVALARRAEARLVDAQRDLGIENLDDHAAAEARASALAVRSGALADAVAHAELAVALAPDASGAWLALARARFAREPAHPASAASMLWAGVAAAARSPEIVRALLGDALAAGIAALAGSAAVVFLLVALRRIRPVLHDVRHLPLLRHATPLQATFVAVVLLAAPVALRLGPVGLLVSVAAAVAFHIDRAERLVVTMALAVVAALPWTVQRAAELSAWRGTVAADVYDLEHGAAGDAVVARLERRADRGDPDLAVPARLALARHHRRRGDLERALRLYEAVGPTRAQSLVGLGNVQLLRGDPDAARASYLAAVDLASATADPTALAAAQFDLSRAFLRRSALGQAQEARHKAVLADPDLIERHGVDDDYRANRWVIDVPTTMAELREMASREVPRSVGSAVLARLAGPLPATAWGWAFAGVVALLWLLPAGRERLRPSHACESCGRAACSRCGASGRLCGQCVNVFRKPGLVDPADRDRKHREVARHVAVRRWIARALALGTGGGGHLWDGAPVRGAVTLAALLFLVLLAMTGSGVLPTRHGVPGLAAAKAGVAGALAFVTWAVAVRAVFRRTRS